MSRIVATGYATPAGLLLRCGDGLRLVEPTRTPIGAALADLLASGVEPCPVCGRVTCDCDEWSELMYTDPVEEQPCVRCHRYNCNCAAQPFSADPHGDLSWRESEEVPF